ncbi:hypothetical protein H4582DRAFT_1791808, partial [Lactarius indigo]
DLPSLPHIRAMIMEALRRSLSAQFGVPYASSTDDRYVIPKGVTILPNKHVINFDPTVFDSDCFSPAGYLDEKGQVDMPVDGHREGHALFRYRR